MLVILDIATKSRC